MLAFHGVDMHFLIKVNLCMCAPRFMLKKSKPELNKSHSSARLLQEVHADKDDYDHLAQSTTVILFNYFYTFQTEYVVYYLYKNIRQDFYDSLSNSPL